MKRKTRMLALALSAVSLLCMMPMGAGATYDACDVNHDGSVDITDVIALNHHLLGTKYYTNYNQLDANRSHTVDKADATCIMSKLVHTSYSACYIRQCGDSIEAVDMPAVSSTVTLDNSATTTTGQNYKRYSYSEEAYLSSYTLMPTIANLSATQNVQTRDIINGDDNRSVAHGYENTGIVYLENYGTGFIVGDHEIATAAHCVFDRNGIRKNINILTYDQGGNPDGGELHISEIHLPQEYSYIKANTVEDYALITVEEDLSDRVQFSIGNSYNMTNSEVGTIPLHVTGIPDETGVNPEITNADHLLYTHYGNVYGNNNRSFLYHTVDTTSGQSGSPIYTITRERYNNTDYYTYTALAIHTTGPDTGYNYGPLMTKYHLQFFRNNPFANYQ